MSKYFIYKRGPGRGYYMPLAMGYTGSILSAGVFDEDDENVVFYKKNTIEEVDLIPVETVRSAIESLMEGGRKQAKEAEVLLQRLDEESADD